VTTTQEQPPAWPVRRWRGQLSLIDADSHRIVFPSAEQLMPHLYLELYHVAPTKPEVIAFESYFRHLPPGFSVTAPRDGRFAFGFISDGGLLVWESEAFKAYARQELPFQPPECPYDWTDPQ
jgi:hypothetical protein